VCGATGAGLGPHSGTRSAVDGCGTGAGDAVSGERSAIFKNSKTHPF